MIDADWWAHALGFGLIVAVACGMLLIAVLFLAPYTFLSDYPEDIRTAAPKPTLSQRRAGGVAAAIFLLTLFAGVGGVTWMWGATHHEAGFFELMLMALVVSCLFAIFDIVVVDWLIICTWRPRRLVYPGTEMCPGWRDYGFHVKEQLRPRGLAALFGTSAAIGLFVWWLT